MRMVRNLWAGCGALALAAGVAFSEPAKPVMEKERMAIGAGRAMVSTPDLNGLVGVERSTVCRLEVPGTMDAPFVVAVPVDGDEFTVQVERHSVRSENYQVRVQLADGSFVNVEPGPVMTFRGEILEIPGSKVAGSLVDGGVLMRMQLPDGNEWWVESIVAKVPGAAAGDHVVYHRDDALPSGGVCGTPEAFAQGEHPADVGTHGVACGGLCIAQLGCDADFEYFTDFGSVAAVENRINAIINGIDLEYETEVLIRHEISGIVVRTAEPDPYTSTSSGTLVGQVRTEWLNNQDAIEHDLAHLFTGKEIDGSTIGQAFTIGGVCTSSGYAYSQAECCGSTACAIDLVAHEIGHLWGGIHVGDPSCIMVTPLSCTATQFCPSNINEIESHRDSRTCLTGAENGTTGIPFSDTFPSTTIDASKWTGIQGAASNTLANNEPSAPNSLNIDGSDQIRSAIMDASSFTNLVLGYKKQVRGTQDSPETGDDLIIEIFDNTSTWVEVGRHLGSLPDENTFTTHSINLGSNAQHDGLRIRFRGVSTAAGSDDWFVDDVTLTGNAVVPGPFNLLSPANGATNVSFNPPFDWSDSANATSYNFQIDDNADFSSPLFNLNRTVSNVAFGADFLNPNTTYYWKATASNTNGTVNSTPVSHSFTTQGGGGPTPEVRVTRGTAEILDGGSYDYGSTSVGVPVERVYTIYNDGTATMTLGALSVPSGYTVTKALPASLNAGASATFKIRFDAPSNGSFSGTAQFTNNDSDENPFNWTVTGVAAGPAIARVQKGTSTTIPNGGSDNYGSTPVGTPKSRTYKLYNDGGVALTASGLTVPSGFSVTKALPTNILSGAFKTFRVQLDAIAPGSYSGSLSFSTNDSTNNPYVFTVSGTVTGSLFNTGGQYGAAGASKMAASGHFGGSMATDLLAVSSTGTVVILTGDGSGAFIADGEFGLGGSPASVVVGDFNNDGLSDAAALSGGTLSILMGSADGVLRAGNVYSLPGNGASMVASDMTGDARTDLLVTDDSGAISLFSGIGDGAFEGRAIAGLDRPAGAIEALHLNADSRPDFAVSANNGGHLSFFVSDESGGFSRAGFVNVAGKVSALHAGNFDGDGHADLVAVSDTGAAVLVRSGDGGPAVGGSITIPDADSASLARDLNADGITDLVFTDRANNAVVVRLGGEDGEFAAAINLDAGFVPSSLAAGDFNGDGGLDLAVFEVGGANLRVLENMNPWNLCGGDATGDQRVDFTDLQVVLTSFGKVGMTRDQGDVDGDSDVDFDDLTGVLSAFGNVCE